MFYLDQLSHYTPKDLPPCRGDFYVATDGDDSADGSEAHPFRTVERAVTAARAAGKPVTVCVHAGEYRCPGITFGPEDSGTPDCPTVYRICGDGETVLNGGVLLPNDRWESVPLSIRDRLHGPAKEKVRRINLTQLGLTYEDWGPLYPIGAFGTEDKYDDFRPGNNCELFCNGRRMTLARYPDEGWLKLSDVADVGDCSEFPEQCYDLSWHEKRNPRGGKYIMDKETARRAEGWQSDEDIWVYGYFCHDWADSATRVRMDAPMRAFYPEHVSYFGARPGKPYYFYNVLEELDQPGEWYLDRSKGFLYFYPPENDPNPRIEITITGRPLFGGEGIHDLVLDGFTLKGTRDDAVRLKGERITLRRLNITQVMGYGAVLEGRDHLVTDCEISHVGRGGISLSGGDRETLTPGNNVADNNLIHDWAEVFQMYNGGIRLEGVGNRCSHNELYNAPHTAVFYYGNDHIIEYNLIHDVVLVATDAGAIYSGQDWTRQGDIVRYNCLYNIGGPNSHPDGIYFDDMLSGQTAYGNVLAGIRKNGFLIGGGRDIHVENNLLISCGTGLKYDDRARDGFLHNGWAKHSVLTPGANMWAKLNEVPFRGEIWAKRYPLLARTSEDFSKPDDPDFAVNPSYSTVINNLIIGTEEPQVLAYESVPMFSRMEKNPVFASMEEAGLDPQTGLLAEDAPAREGMEQFTQIPYGKIGRY